MKSKIQKLAGTLTLGPLRHTHDFEIYSHLRVGDDFMTHVKIPGVLATLLRDGKRCTLWVATLEIPTPLFFKSKTYIVYAVEVDGQVHNVADQVARGWSSAKWLLVGALLLCTLATFLMFIWPLFLINSFRMALVDLPVDEMRREPAGSSLSK